MTENLFEGFDPTEVAAAAAAHQADLDQLGTVRAHARAHILHTRCVASADSVSSLVPATIAPGHSVHVLSSGDVDVLTYTAHLLTGVAYLDRLVMTTWRINRSDLELIATWCDAGLVERFDLMIDQRFGRLAPDEYGLAREITAATGGQVTTFLNHSKVTLLSNPDTHYVIESSANVNTNHRLEQTAIHHSRELHAFYLEAFDGISRRKHRA
jgi:hypothetical protein